MRLKKINQVAIGENGLYQYLLSKNGYGLSIEELSWIDF